MTTPSGEEDEEMLRALKDLRVDPPGGHEFGAALHRRLVAAGAPPAPSWTARLREALTRRPALLWPSVGVLCGVLAFVTLQRWSGTPNRPVAQQEGPTAPGPMGEVAPTYQVPSSKVAVIKLNFAASVDVADVDFEVELPEGLHFWSGGQKLAERVFRWPGELRAGDNLIPIAVRGERAGLYRVKARAVAAGEIVEHEIVLDVKGGA
jgi:hypothetical protein